MHLPLLPCVAGPRRAPSATSMLPRWVGGPCRAAAVPFRSPHSRHSPTLAQVGRFAFRLLHRLEGRWTGEAEVHVPGVSQAVNDVRVCTVHRA